ncbi:MAG: hypothetical protein WBG90_02715 [Saonia sp.]
MKRTLAAILFSGMLFCLSCSDDDDNNAQAQLTACAVENVLEDLVWLRDEISDREQSTSEDMKYCYIVIADLEGQTVFLYEDCNPLINKVVPVFDCEGESLGFIGTDVSMDDLKDFCVIWRPADFACLIDFVCVIDN